jgi:hypothetical protein
MPFVIFVKFRLRNHFILAQVYAKITRFSVSARILLKYIHFFLEKQLIFSGCLEHFLPTHTYFRENLAKCHQNIFSKWSLYIFHMLLTIFLPFIVIKFRKSQHLIILAKIFVIFVCFRKQIAKLGAKKCRFNPSKYTKLRHKGK